MYYHMNSQTYEWRCKCSDMAEKTSAACSGPGCPVEHNHTRILQLVRQELPTDELLCDLADLFKIFGDTTRMKILFALLESEMCVCAIAELLGMTQSAISHQLRILKDADLVGNRREGKTVYYFLSDDHVRTIVAQGFEHLMERKREA